MVENTDLSERASEGKRSIGRSVSINGMHAVDVEMKQSENLNDPLLDINFKINNPIGRLWLALKRIWKSQNTIISLRFTIPLLVLPIAIYVIYLLLQGRGMTIPMSKLGMIHQVSISGSPRDIFVLPTSDVYLIEYDTSFNQSSRLAERPVIVVGSYKESTNVFRVESLTPYSQLDIPKTDVFATEPRTMWDTIYQFVAQFK